MEAGQSAGFSKYRPVTCSRFRTEAASHAKARIRICAVTRLYITSAHITHDCAWSRHQYSSSDFEHMISVRPENCKKHRKCWILLCCKLLGGGQAANSFAHCRYVDRKESRPEAEMDSHGASMCRMMMIGMLLRAKQARRSNNHDEAASLSETYMCIIHKRTG